MVPQGNQEAKEIDMGSANDPQPFQMTREDGGDCVEMEFYQRDKKTLLIAPPYMLQKIKSLEQAVAIMNNDCEPFFHASDNLTYAIVARAVQRAS